MSTKLHDTKGDDWNASADDYIKHTKVLSEAPNGLLFERADALYPLSKATGILDNGCGPGPLMSRLIKDYGTVIPESCTLACADFSEGMIAQVRKTKEAAGSGSPWAKVDLHVQDAMDLQAFPSESQSHVTAGMVYFMTPDPMKCLTESRRVLKPDGVLALTSWKGSQWMDLMNLLPKVRPEKTTMTLPEAWTSTQGLEGEFKKAGFRDVEAHEVQVEMPFPDHETWAKFLTSGTPHMTAMTKDLSEEEMKRFEDLIKEEMKKMAPTEPGKLKGVSLVAVGRK